MNKAMRLAAMCCCIVAVLGGVFVTLATCGWQQLDGIATILAGGVLLPYFAED